MSSCRATNAKVNMLRYFAGDQEVIEAVTASVVDRCFFENDGGWWNGLGVKLREKLAPLYGHIIEKIVNDMAAIRSENHQLRAWAERVLYDKTRDHFVFTDDTLERQRWARDKLSEILAAKAGAHGSDADIEGTADERKRC